MKLVRVGASSAEIPALLAADGTLRDISYYVRDIDGEALSPASLDKLSAIDPTSCPIIDNTLRIGACVARPLNFVCIGLNYAEQAAEAAMALPKEPIVFLKALSAYCGPFDDVEIPPGAKKVDWEVELGIVIGTKARRVAEEQAMEHVAGYTKDEVPDPQALGLCYNMDGVSMQHGDTRTMTFGVRHLVSYVSHFFTRHPGDVIATGTPSGVGLGKKPEPMFLRAGQSMQAGLQGLGEQRQLLVAT